MPKAEEGRPTLIRSPEVQIMTGLPKSSIDAGIRKGTFPKPVKIGVRSVAWVKSEVLGWIYGHINSQEKPLDPTVTIQPELKKFVAGERVAQQTKWRKWAFDDTISHAAERHLRKCISAAWLRLARLDDKNPEVCHARKLLECALSGENPAWP